MSEKGKDMNIFDRDYKNWIKDISSRFRRSQIKAATHVNEEMLRFYWSLGRDINFRQNENSYGSDFFRKLSADMKKELPDVKAFSVTNLHYMVWFYELYPDAINLPQAGVNSDSPVFHIPWGHNKLIIDTSLWCLAPMSSTQKFAWFNAGITLI